MTNLTEQWKKGELECGYYYVKNEFGNIFPSDYSEDYDYVGDTVIKDFFTEVFEIKEVLEPVPSYEEWQAKLEENTKLKKWCEAFNALEVVIENEQLKKLLKECFVAINEGTFQDQCEMLHKINQVLGEE